MSIPEYSIAPLSGELFPDLYECQEIWDRVRGERFAPSWSELDFLSFPINMISSLYLVDVLTAPLDFRYNFALLPRQALH